MRFPQTTPIDVAIKSLDCSQSSRGMEDLQNKEADRNWHRFGADLGGFDTFVSKSSQKNLESVIMYWKVLFIPEIWRNNGVLCLLVIARGLPGSLRFGDTW